MLSVPLLVKQKNKVILILKWVERNLKWNQQNVLKNKMTKRELLNIIDEEITNVKWGIVNEEITNEDEKKIREIIRTELSAIFFDLFKKRKTWGA